MTDTAKGAGEIVEDLLDHLHQWALKLGNESELGPLNTFKRMTATLIERVSKAEQALAQAQAENQRLTDLVRYSRHYLHEEQLIDDKEFAGLVADSENSMRVQRLEGYDRIQEKIAALQAERDTLKAEVLTLKSANEDARLNYQTLEEYDSGLADIVSNDAPGAAMATLEQKLATADALLKKHVDGACCCVCCCDDNSRCDLCKITLAHLNP
jgi:uncharacterized small protein (DUF1192 family)